MVITLDIDYSYREYIDEDERQRTELEMLMILFNVNYICRNTRCRICLTRNGLHIYIDDYTRLRDFPRREAVRRVLRDDPLRLDADSKRFAYKIYNFLDTLFSQKVEIYAKKKVFSFERCMDFAHFFSYFVRSIISLETLVS